MPKVVALELTDGQRLFDALRQCYDDGHTACVLDPRDSRTRRSAVMASLRPTHHLTDDGTAICDGGVPSLDGDGVIVLTSGSSGPPKAAVLTWDALRASAEMSTLALQRGASTRWWANLTPVHVGGLAVYLRSLFHNQVPIFASTQRDALRQGATHVAVVRTQLQREGFSDFELVLLGGGPPPPDVPANVVTTWGMTETASGVVYDGVALPSVALRIVDDEIHVASPTLLRAYRDGVDPTYRDDDDVRWLPTGDVGELRGGILHVRGRRDYVINTGGEKVWPDDLERALSECAGVRDVAVFGRDDDEWGQRVVVWCVSDRTAHELAGEFRERAVEAIGRWAVPKEVEVVKEIPRTSNGKIRRSELI
jgi:O-succinylbenzoic acid--CoA ligase